MTELFSDQPNKTTQNAPTPKNVGEFWSYIISKGGAAKPCRFLVSFRKPNFSDYPENLRFASDYSKLNDLIFQCESAQLPPRNLSTYDTITLGPNVKLPYQTAFNDLTLTFFCSQDMYERRIFDSWFSYINDDNDFLFTYRDDYATEITIFQYDEGTNGKANCRYSVQFYDAFPIALGEMPLSWADQNIHKLTVVFTYTKWKSFAQEIPILNAPAFNDLRFSGIGNTIIGKNIIPQINNNFA